MSAFSWFSLAFYLFNLIAALGKKDPFAFIGWFALAILVPVVCRKPKREIAG